jgi:hypothetical protein
MEGGERFEIKAPNLTFWVTPFTVKGEEIFRIEFSDHRPPLIVTEVLLNYKSFWTSVPEGRQVEADYFGKCIEEYLKNK